MTARVAVGQAIRGAARRALRRAAIAAGSALLITCGDSATPAGRPGFANVAVKSIIAAGHSATGLTLNRVRLVVVRPPSTTLLDKTYTFPESDAELRINEPVLLLAARERLQITLTFLSDDTELFTGTTTAEVSQGEGEPVEVPVAYVGPGSQVAAISIAPRDTVISFGATLTFRVTAMDAQEHAVTEFYVAWTSDDPARVPDGGGTLVAGSARGTLNITARTPTGVEDVTTVRVVPPPSQLQKLAGDAQMAEVSTRLPQPIEVEVRGADNQPVPGARVTFAAVSGGTVDESSAISDANGRARTGATLGPNVGRQDFTATVVGAGSVTFSATATQLPSVSFDGASQTVSEQTEVVSIAVRLSAPSAQAVSVPFTVSGTASSSDYVVSGSPLVIPAGAVSTAITVAIVADQVAEPDESIVVTMGSPVNAAPGGITSHTLTILGQTPIVSFTTGAQTLAEGASATITAQLSMASTQAVTVPYGVSGTASAGDYSIAASPLVISPGQLTGTIAVSATADGVAEGAETVVVNMGSATNAVVGTTSQHTVTIPGQVPVVAFQVASQTVNEGTTATVSVSLSSPAVFAVTVPFTLAGSATMPADYTVSASPIIIGPGSTTATLTIAVANDQVAEGSETAVIILGTPINATLGAITQHTVTIPGQTPSVSFTSATQIIFGEGGTFTIEAQLSLPSTLTVTAPFTVEGTATPTADYTISASPISFAPGSTSASITGTIVRDGIAEPDEELVVVLGVPTNAVVGPENTSTVVIAGETPIVSFAAGAQTVAEGSASVSIAVQLSSPSSQQVVVPFTLSGTATSGVDYTISPSPITIPAGSAGATIVLAVLTDQLAEQNESIVVTLGTPLNASLGQPAVHTLTIAAQLPTVSFTSATQSVSEGTSVATFVLQLSSASTQTVVVPLTISGTATPAGASAGDYSIVPTGQVTFNPGTISALFNVNIVNDAIVEPDETVIVTLGTPTGAVLGATTQHTTTIVDNDLTLGVQFGGRGSGTVVSQAATPVINCSTGSPTVGCSANYQSGTQVTLLATPQATSEGIFRFEGWSSTAGLTCTTNPTCVVSMTQHRNVTARFSTWGTLAFSPTSASFSFIQGSAAPPPVNITVSNVGDRPLALSTTIPIVYQAGAPANWLSAQLDRFTVDTLTPARLTLAITDTKLGPGTYSADVIIRDSGIQRSWVVPVTVTVGSPPVAPVISNVVARRRTVSDNNCNLDPTRLGTSWDVSFDYTDANGDGPRNLDEASLTLDFTFTSGQQIVFTNYTRGSSLNGNGSTGQADTFQCYVFGSNANVTVSMSIVDASGRRSVPVSFVLTKPSGAN